MPSSNVIHGTILREKKQPGICGKPENESCNCLNGNPLCISHILYRFASFVPNFISFFFDSFCFPAALVSQFIINMHFQRIKPELHAVEMHWKDWIYPKMVAEHEFFLKSLYASRVDFFIQFNSNLKPKRFHSKNVITCEFLWYLEAKQISARIDDCNSQSSGVINTPRQAITHIELILIWKHSSHWVHAI